MNLGEEMKEGFNRLAKETHSDMKEAQNLVEDLDGFNGFRAYYGMKVTGALKQIYHHQNGSSLPRTGQEALDRTEDACVKALSELCVAAFCDGVLVGQGTCSAVKKQAFFQRIDKVFKMDSFRTDSDALVLTAITEYDVVETCEYYVKSSAAFMAAASGFGSVDVNDDEELKFVVTRVWDVWLLTAQSALIGMYACGHSVGLRFKTADTLDGILAATEETE